MATASRKPSSPSKPQPFPRFSPEVHHSSSFPLKHASPTIYDLQRRQTARSRKMTEADHYRPHLKGREWQPGQEPGIAASAIKGPKQHCDISIVDISQDNISVHPLDNDSLEDFLNIAPEKWVQCRWININGISSDVIQILAHHKRFHRLAIEDMMNSHNRTKADWYANQTYGWYLLSCIQRIH